MKIVGWLAKFRVGICLGRFGIVGKVIGRGVTSSPLGCLLLLFAVLGSSYAYMCRAIYVSVDMRVPTR